MIALDKTLLEAVKAARGSAGTHFTTLRNETADAVIAALELSSIAENSLLNAADEAHRIGVRNAEDDVHPACSRRVGLAIQKAIQALSPTPRPTAAHDEGISHG